MPLVDVHQHPWTERLLEALEPVVEPAVHELLDNALGVDVLEDAWERAISIRSTRHLELAL